MIFNMLYCLAFTKLMLFFLKLRLFKGMFSVICVGFRDPLSHRKAQLFHNASTKIQALTIYFIQIPSSQSSSTYNNWSCLFIYLSNSRNTLSLIKLKSSHQIMSTMTSTCECRERIFLKDDMGHLFILMWIKVHFHWFIIFKFYNIWPKNMF